MQVAVLGAGSWGTALGATLAGKGYPVTLWDTDVSVLDDITSTHRNARYLPGIELPPTLSASADVTTALNGARLVVMAVPSHAVRGAAVVIAPYLTPGVAICSAAKGIEVDTLMTMSEVLQDVLPAWLHEGLTFLSGPSFATEVAAGLPTAVTVAGLDEQVTRQVQAAFHTASFRPYTSTDVVGVEVAGCVKNVVAIAAGICDGLGFGANARAALITRGLVEITRLAVCRGADPMTLVGLAGLGDLVLTCSSELSRNRTVGFELGRGRALPEIQASIGQVAEGVINSRSTRALAHRFGVDMPISEAVYQVLFEGYSPQLAVQELMTRQTKPESEGYPALA
ncbi:MAG TPA: NAD(P)H-dependent glycerol-3-phosphate dehydrogenase [Kineosporiaceae bacterium]|jgi:glycerol-3-phosphate dehydrogenase (NAD(P)+)|nr:NAD(P)H-dependent glycerol-3-phosphate dehydrogenase [Kineosporiaceae bacterium]